MEMKGVFLTYNQINRQQMTGIDKKIISQIDAFSKAGLNCSNYVMKTRNMTILRKMLFLLPFCSGRVIWKYDEQFDTLDYIYFRRGATMCYQMRRMLHLIKVKNPHIKIIMEIPNYPYDNESKGIKGIPSLLKERYNRKRLKGLVNRLGIVSHNEFDEVWGLKTISFINGCDISSITPKIPKPVRNQIHLICVAVFSRWHGYERLIEGVNEYYSHGGQREIILHMVGEGPETAKYRQLVEMAGLKDRIIFHGLLNGKELDDIYDICDMAVASLGLYKIGVVVQNSLKTREYMAKGLPIISGCSVDVLYNRDFKYYCEFPNNGSCIDMNRVVGFYDAIYNCDETRETIVNHIRNFARETVDMDKVMKPIINYIKYGR